MGERKGKEKRRKWSRLKLVGRSKGKEMSNVKEGLAVGNGSKRERMDGLTWQR